MKLTKFVFLVVRQIYKTDGSQEYVIVGNDALIKCQYPSFVSDFLTILGWANSEGEFYSGGQDNHGIGPVLTPHCTPTLSHVSFLVIYISISVFSSFYFTFQLLIRPIELLSMRSQLSWAMMFSLNVTSRALSQTLSTSPTGLILKDQPSLLVKVLVINLSEMNYEKL